MNLNKKVFIGLLSLLISSFSLSEELLLKNAKIHTATDKGTIEKADILIRDGIIVKIGKNIVSYRAVEKDLSGKVISTVRSGIQLFLISFMVLSLPHIILPSQMSRTRMLLFSYFRNRVLRQFLCPRFYMPLSQIQCFDSALQNEMILWNRQLHG